MRKKQFSNIVRSGVWSAYNHRCFYCNKDIDWNDLHIDHIMPESLSDNPKELLKIIQSYQLPSDFEINKFQNLVPTHSFCNQRKSNTLFSQSTTLYYLELASQKVPRIVTEIEKIQRRKNKGRLISNIETAIDTNLLTPEEIEKILLRAKENQWKSKAIKLEHGLEFIDQVYDIFYLDSDFTEFYDKKLVIPMNTDYVVLYNDHKKTKKVSTLREWQDALSQGYYPFDNATIKVSHRFVFLEEFISAIQIAKMPKVSFLSDPWLDLSSFDLLSADILPNPFQLLKDRHKKNTSIEQLIKEGLVEVNNGNYYQISLLFDGLQTSLREIFRADFSGNGIEDIFVRGWTHDIGGTLGFGFTRILTKSSETELIGYATN